MTVIIIFAWKNFTHGNYALFDMSLITARYFNRLFTCSILSKIPLNITSSRIRRRNFFLLFQVSIPFNVRKVNLMLWLMCNLIQRFYLIGGTFESTTICFLSLDVKPSCFYIFFFHFVLGASFHSSWFWSSCIVFRWFFRKLFCLLFFKFLILNIKPKNEWKYKYS